MEVKIGIQNAARELTIDVEESAADVQKLVADAVANDGVLTLRDSKGRQLLVPVTKLAYVELGHGTVGQVGFRS
ncbi:DUF3107 family protein [Nocardioides sp. LMS-CY]|uniref:DUF3107 domain-containing protein n=1 Tax=Nocardioides soli TaxID=1036020 RepID=A0A7W4VX31_9ACTN|nr:DUF3107 domain-containing protein [Nocardioides sp. LMS-CY]MBB3043260.1 hypothetical protein [Nocardioides soli]QWF21080.1 DUF3107 family protein [Nocardioides sp. LMS-CY]